ncbi:hypothetical protein A8709_31730 [Paenibacillus pectinilyticus]|uniref:Transposase zinc-ribbon domain-containing protein n=1 Tax=Paenibacillus pectinilyticus TaxID=512399 RepID=A0A1C0ZWC9_9BACL|nr:transposase [Paenibacillus pectinilyticus]OCT12399.1 hypothetical protein A8709_31730 [Paenibacillus pectinilyticus]
MKFESIAIDASKCLTEEACEDFLMNLRWAQGFHCPRCDHHEAFRIRTRRLLECKECRMQVSLTAGTIIHNSKLPLLTWFRALTMLFERGSEITAYGLSELLHINYRSAKLMLQKICLVFKVEESRLKAFKKLKKSYAEARKQKEGPVKSTVKREFRRTPLNAEIDMLDTSSGIKDMSSKECRTYLSNLFSETFAGFDRLFCLRSPLRYFVSIHLYRKFLKCFQL